MVLTTYWEVENEHNRHSVEVRRTEVKLGLVIIRESVDSLCRDGADTPIVRVHRKAF